MSRPESVPTIDRLLLQARRELARIEAEDLRDEMRRGALVVDIRPAEQRDRDGELDGAVVIDRNVLEWRLDPTSPYRIQEADPDRLVIVMCNEGYQSSLAAATLKQIGVRRATDLVGGFKALRALAH